MLLSHHRESLGREGCHLTEYTNAMGAALTDTVTRKIMLGNTHYSLSCPLDRFLSHWAHPMAWLREHRSCLPHKEDSTLVQILLLDIHQDPQWFQANIQMQNLSYVPHSAT